MVSAVEHDVTNGFLVCLRRAHMHVGTKHIPVDGLILFSHRQVVEMSQQHAVKEALPENTWNSLTQSGNKHIR